MIQVFQKFNFTRNESRVIIFFILLLLAGILINYLKGSSASVYQGSLQHRSENKQNSFEPGNYPSIINSTLITDGEDKILQKENLRDSVETKSKKKSKKEDKLAGVTINLNTATKEQLILLPGVGESTAEKIIQYRKDHYGFKKIEDMMKIKGIGKKKFEKMKPYITVE